MLSRIVLAGLIPVIMAKPIMLRSEAVARDAVQNLEPSDLLNPNGDDKCGCNKECEQEDGVAGMVMCLSDCLDRCPDGEEIHSRQIVPAIPGAGPGVPVIPGATPSHCASKCDEDCNRVGIPFAEYTHCKDSCASSCSTADQSVTIIESKNKRQIAAGAEGTSYAGCMSDCRSDCTTIDTAAVFLNHCDDACAAQCAEYNHFEEGFVAKREPDSLTGGIEIENKRQIAAGAEGTSYEGCMSDCRSDCTTIDTAAVFLNHCDDACAAQCAGYNHFEEGFVAKRQLDNLLGGIADNSNTPERPGAEPLQSGPTVGNSATSYEGCMSSCKSDCQTLDFPFELTQCDDSCEEQCAALAQGGGGVLPKRQAAPLQSGPTLGSGATTYEGCLSSCRSNCQDLNVASIHLNQCDDGCEAQCARFAHASSGILPREPEVKAPRQVAPFLAGASATTYESCMADCGSDCVTIDTAAVFLNHCKSNCASRCAQYAHFEEEGAVLTKKTIAEKRQAAPLQSGPSLGSGATSYEGCLRGCRSDCQNLNVAAIGLNSCDDACEAQCAGFTQSSEGILPRAEKAVDARAAATAPEAKKRHVGAAPLQSGPVITNTAETYESCLGRCNSDCQGQNFAFQIGRCEEGCSGICQSYAGGGSAIIGG